MKISLLTKTIVAVVVLAWAFVSLLPLTDRGLEAQLREDNTADQQAFQAFLDEARAKVEAQEYKTLYIAVREMARERRLDISAWFPQLPLEASLKNLDRRNQIVLDEMLRRSKASLPLGLDLQGGISFVLEVKQDPALDEALRQTQLEQAVGIIADRIDAFGVAEPVIRPVGANRLEIQLAGLNTRDNPDVIEQLRKPARLEFRLVHPSAVPTGQPNEPIPAGYTVLYLETEGDTGQLLAQPLFVKRVPDMVGGIDAAYPYMDEFGRFTIKFELNAKGKKQFGELTGANVGRSLAIVLDGKLYSAPRINSAIDQGRGVIEGQFSQREAVELSNVLNNPLEVELTVASVSEVGPSLAADAIQSGILAATVGGTAVVLYMVALYAFGGGVAVFALLANVVFILGTLAALRATLSLPGIAGLVLTLGMAVDANILIFERLREERRAGKPLKVALEAAHDRAFSTIVDANLTTLITSAVMILLGSGPVKGFGVTLTIGVFGTLFGTLVVSRVVLDVIWGRGLLTRFPMMPLFGDTRFDFMAYARPAFIASVALVVLGIGVFIYRGSDVYGIDFKGGDEVTFTFEQRLDPAQIRTVAAAAGVTEVLPLYQTPLGGGSEILRLQSPEGTGAILAEALRQAHPEAGLVDAGVSRIGAAVSSEITRNAVYSILAALVGILLYVAFRFEIGFGVGAVASTLHDVLMTVGLYVMLGGEFNSPMIAAILLVAGYSINDTIVVFDRIREELTLDPDASLRKVINQAINRTLTRTLVTGGSSLAAALALFVFGTGSIRDISLTFIIGILTGTFSSVFIASPVFYWYHKGDRRHLEAHGTSRAPTYEWTASSRAAQ